MLRPEKLGALGLPYRRYLIVLLMVALVFNFSPPFSQTRQMLIDRDRTIRATSKSLQIQSVPLQGLDSKLFRKLNLNFDLKLLR